MKHRPWFNIFVVISSALMITLLPLSTPITTTPAQAEMQTSTGPYPGKTQYPWSMFAYDLANTGFSPGTGPKTNHLLWRFTQGYEFRVAEIQDGMLFTCGGPGTPVLALDADTGEVIWKSTVVGGGKGFTIWRDKIYVIDISTPALHCLNEWTGDIVWAFKGTGSWWGPTIAKDYVLVGSWGGYGAPPAGNVLYRLDAATGALIWATNLTDVSGSPGPYGIWCAPAVIDNDIYVTSSDANIYRIDFETGDVVWNFEAGEQFFASATFFDGKIYAGSQDAKFYCLDADTGSLLWYFQQLGPTGGTAAVAYGKVYFSSFDSNVYCLDPQTGKLIWNYTTENGAYSSLAIADGVVYSASLDNYFYALNAETGSLLWKYELDGGVQLSPAVADGRLFIGSHSFYCFGKGPTVIPLSLTASKLGLGESTIVSGSLLDQSPASPDAPVAGVSVDLGYVKEEAMTTVTTVTTDSMGRFSYEWTPTAEGTYDLYASFAGDDSYEASMESVKVQVGPEPPDVPTADEVAQEVLDQLPAYTTMDILIAAVAVVTLVLVVYAIVSVRKLKAT